MLISHTFLPTSDQLNWFETRFATIIYKVDRNTYVSFITSIIAIWLQCHNELVKGLVNKHLIRKSSFVSFSLVEIYQTITIRRLLLDILMNCGPSDVKHRGLSPKRWNHVKFERTQEVYVIITSFFVSHLHRELKIWY